MLAPYKELLSLPGVKRLAVVKLLVGFSEVGIYLPTVLLVEHATDSFAVAGFASMALAIGTTLITPYWGRLCDRYPPGIICSLLTIIWSLSVLSLLAAAHYKSETWVFIAVSFAIGAFSPPTPNVVRRKLDWLGGQRLAKVVMSWENMVTEFCYVAGPLFAAAAIAFGRIDLAVYVCLGLGLLGGALFFTTPTAKTNIEHNEELGQKAPWKSLLAVLFVSMMWITSYDAAVIALQAVAGDMGRPALGGVAVALTSLGGLVGAAVYGAYGRSHRYRREMMVALVLYGVGLLVSALVASWLLLLLVITATGFIGSIPFMLVFLWARDRVGQAQRTEAYVLVTAAFTAGTAIGAAAGGVFVEVFGASEALMLSGVFSVLAAPVVLLWKEAANPSAAISVNDPATS